jgi:hypothetical protein
MEGSLAIGVSPVACVDIVPDAVALLKDVTPKRVGANSRAARRSIAGATADRGDRPDGQPDRIHRRLQGTSSGRSCCTMRSW